MEYVKIKGKGILKISLIINIFLMKLKTSDVGVFVKFLHRKNLRFSQLTLF
jgi:hypothetical protein